MNQTNLDQNNMENLQELKRLFEDLENLPDTQIKFGASSSHDDGSYRMDGLHILELKKQVNIDRYGRYIGVYHHKGDRGPVDFEIHLTSSSNLMNWSDIRVLENLVDMPFLYRVEAAASGGDEWILMAHEQWFEDGHAQVAVNLYYSEDHLLRGEMAFKFIAPNFPGITLQGTPNIYSASKIYKNEHQQYVTDIVLGFHYNENGRDKIGNASLNGFGGPNEWYPSIAAHYMNNITFQGATGNVGQRGTGLINNSKILLQEGNIQGNPPNAPEWDFGAWRLWLYNWKNTQGDPEASWPTPEWPLRETPRNQSEYYFYPIFPRTPKRSTSFGNPSVHVVTSPIDINQKCVFVHYFLFSEGASLGEAGPLIYYKTIPNG